MVDRLTEFAERKISKHALAVILQSPQVIRLMQVLHDNFKMIAHAP